jgi:hypothetical protein
MFGNFKASRCMLAVEPVLSLMPTTLFDSLDAAEIMLAHLNARALAARDSFHPYAFHFRLHFAVAISAYPSTGTVAKILGQFRGHDMPVWLNMHWPHIRQSKSKPFTACSMVAVGFSIRAYPI